MKYPHVAAGEKYAKDVIAGKIEACKYVRLACERHFRDKQRKDWRWRFNPARAERKARFIELFPHTKGQWAARNEPFVLQPWQCFLVLSIFGWIDRANPKIRRFIRALLMVPRKNGKSDIGARIGLSMFADDEEFGAEVYSGATTEKQAWEVFGPANKMAKRTTAFQEHYGVEVMASNLHIPANGSKFEPVIGKPGDGASPSCAITDEYHEHADDTLLDTMETGMGARERPLSLIISTAGDNLSGPCYSLQKDLEKILEGTAENERFWGMIYGLDEGDDWTVPETLRKANPNYGVSVSEDFLLGKQQEAIRNARKQGVFKTKHQNVWVGALQAYFNLEDWLKCTKPDIKPEDFRYFPLYVGLDLASKIDIAAFYLVFKLSATEYAGFGRFYAPESVTESNESYAAWAHEGRLTLNSGSMTDFDVVEKDLKAIHEQFGIKGLAFDPAQAPQIFLHLQDAGVPMVELKTTVANCSEPMKTLDGLIQNRKFQHDGCPVMTWMVSNVVCPQRLLLKDMAFPEKDKAENKIDGPVALINGLSQAIVGKDATSVYESRGLLVL